MYKVVITDKALKALEKIPKEDTKRFFRKVDVIAQNPYADLPFVKRLQNSQNFRFRFGDYRGVYAVENKVLMITIIDVAHRSEIYRR